MYVGVKKTIKTTMRHKYTHSINKHNVLDVLSNKKLVCF